MARNPYAEQEAAATQERSATEVKRQATVKALLSELKRIATDDELAEAFPSTAVPVTQEDDMAEEKDKKVGMVSSGLSRSADAAKLGLAMFGADKVGKGAMAIAKRPFPEGSKTREFLETDEGRHLILGLMAVIANIAAESEKTPLEADDIEWVTEAVIANSVLFGANQVADVAVEKIMASGMELWQFVLGLKQPESMADVINMTQKALDVENATFESDADAEAEAEAEVELAGSVVGKEAG